MTKKQLEITNMLQQIVKYIIATLGARSLVSSKKKKKKKEIAKSFKLVVMEWIKLKVEYDLPSQKESFNQHI